MIRNTLDFYNSEYLEITTGIGCSINCKKYCPQEIFIDAYRGEKKLSFDKFKLLIETVPKNIIITFGGFSEPFLNDECTDMIIYAFNQGYPIALFTTLVGLSIRDMERLKYINFEIIFLHLPDSYDNANIPETDCYNRVLYQMMKSHPNIVYVSMNGFFKTNNRETLMRGGGAVKKGGYIHCMKYNAPQFMVLPNGNVHMCCMDMNLKYKVGNLFEESYVNIRDSVRYPKEICRYCDGSTASYINTIKDICMRLYAKL